MWYYLERQQNRNFYKSLYLVIPMRLTEILKANNLSTAALLGAVLATPAAANIYNPQQKLIDSGPGCVKQLRYLEAFPEETLNRDDISEVIGVVSGLKNLRPEKVGEYLENNKDGFELLPRIYPQIMYSGEHRHMCGFVLDAYKQVLEEYSFSTSSSLD